MNLQFVLSLGCAAVLTSCAPALSQDQPAAPGAMAVTLDYTPVAHVEVRGTGEIPVVLIPGVSADWTIWDAFMQRNTERYTMYALTLPGFGGTEPPELPDKESYETLFGTRNAIKALRGFIAEKKLDRPVLIGHGWGGHVALLLALETPELTRTVISLDGMPHIPMSDPNFDEDFEGRKKLIREKTLPLFMRQTEDEWKNRQFLNAQNLVSDDRRANDVAIMLNKTDRGVSIHYFLETLLSDARPELAELKVPTLFIAAVPPADSGPPQVIRQYWRTSVGAPPNTALVFYDNTRHYIMDDNAERLDRDVDLFIRGEDVPEARKSKEWAAEPAEEGPGLPRR